MDSYIIPSVIGLFSLLIISLLLIQGYNKITERIDELESEANEFNQPFSNVNWAQSNIREWLSTKGRDGVNLGEIDKNYKEANFISTVWGWRYWNKYHNHYWNISIEYIPADLHFATCVVYDVRDYTYCDITEEGIDLIVEYS